MTANIPVITIDGPGGAGKGTLCKAMAEALGWHLLDSGAIYRVLALAALHQQGLIEVAYGGLRVLNLAALRAYSVSTEPV